MVSSMVQADSPLFADDHHRVPSDTEGRRWKILVVDDDPDVLAVTRLVFASFKFEGQGIDMLTAESSQQAKHLLLHNDDLAMAFVDVVMETDRAGLDLVRYIREELDNNDIQIVLRTGQPGYAPEMQVILEYGINDYRTKTELDNVKLVTALVSALRNYKNIVSARQAVREQQISEEIQRTKTLFFAQISHDFRAPLNGILGFCQLLAISPLQAEQQQQVGLIRQSGEHLLSLVNDILDLSKAEAGKIQLHCLPVNLAELVEQTARLLQPQLKPGVQLNWGVDSKLPPLVLGDATRIKQIVCNLLSNAIKFTDAGCITVKLTGEPLMATKWRFELSVADTGMGIPAARLPTLFTAYEQGGSGVAHSFGGTGLGLAICKQLASLMEGDIQVQSQPGEGTCFRVSILLPTVSSKPQPPVASLLPNQAAGAVGEARPARILVVDDDAISRMLAAKMLSRRGFEVVCSEDGKAALELIQQQEFDLLFVDCMMPNMDGYELSSRVRQLRGYAKAPLIALTGADAGDEMQRCFAAGMNDFMQKPIELDRLNAMVNKWLGLKALM